MRPDQFIRDPLRWIRTMSGLQHSVSPPFGLDYAARRLSPEDIAGLDLTSWKSLTTGAECVDLTALHAFSRLVEPAGFNPTALIAAYGLAEATLLVTGTPVDEPISAVRIDKASLQFESVLPRREMGRPEEIASAALCLASEDSSYVNGMELVVDGGTTVIGGRR